MGNMVAFLSSSYSLESILYLEGLSWGLIVLRLHIVPSSAGQFGNMATYLKPIFTSLLRG